jgi:hypothetical protein
MEDNAAPLVPGGTGVLRAAVRVVKNGMADGVAKLRPVRQAVLRRGLRSEGTS